MKNVLLYLEKNRGVKARSRSLQTREYNANDLYRFFFPSGTTRCHRPSSRETRTQKERATNELIMCLLLKDVLTAHSDPQLGTFKYKE